MTLLALALLAVLPPELPHVEDTVDLLEVNHIFDHKGEPYFDQIIFWDWTGDRYAVVAWRQAKTSDQWPHWNFGSKRYVTVWSDDGTIRKVTAAAYRETFTQSGWDGDPEVRDQELLPKHERRGLRDLPKRFRQAGFTRTTPAQ